MSTQVRFRLSGDAEQKILEAAEQAGLSVDDYCRRTVLIGSMPLETTLASIEERLSAQEEREARARAQNAPILGQEQFLIEVKREVVAGFNTIIRLLDGPQLPDPQEFVVTSLNDVAR